MDLCLNVVTFVYVNRPGGTLSNFHVSLGGLEASISLLIDSNINIVCLLAVRNIVNVSGLGKYSKYF